MKQGLRWSLGDGTNISFWYYCWLQCPISEMVQLDIPPDLSITVSQFIDNGKWNTILLTGVVTPIILKQILGIPIPCLITSQTQLYGLSLP